MTVPSEFYPPRARWPSLRSRWTTRQSFRAKGIFRKSDALGCSPAELVLSFLLPAYVFNVFGHRRVALALALAYIVAAAAFVYWVGYYASAFIAMISIHVSSAGFLCKRVLPEVRFVLRLMVALTLFGLLYTLAYKPAHEWFEKLVTPLRVGEKVVIINRSVPPKTIHRGEWIAYKIHGGGRGRHGNALAVVPGFGFSEALAVPGDTVSFSPGKFAVNGVEQSAKPYMPATGSLTLSRNQWFVWPELVIGGYRRANEQAISATLLNLGTITEEEFVGKPVKRWFWKTHF